LPVSCRANTVAEAASNSAIATDTNLGRFDTATNLGRFDIEFLSRPPTGRRER
jgi:hypothetical protein